MPDKCRSGATNTHERSTVRTPGPRPVVSIAASADDALGALAAPLDADLKAEQIAAVVWRALDLDTSPRNLRALVKPGAWVVLKPNLVTAPMNPKSDYWYGGCAHPGQNTDARVIKAVIDYILDRCEPGRVTIAEGGAEWCKLGEANCPPDVTEDDWTYHWPEFGGLSYADLVADWAKTHPGVVDIVDLNYDERRFLPVPDPRGSGVGALQRTDAQARPAERYGRDVYLPDTGRLRPGYAAAATLLDCDVLISCPAIKTHIATATTLAIKNYIGTMEPSREHPNSKSVAHQGKLAAGFVDAFSYHPADYSVLEGFWATEGNGPQWGDDIHHNVVVAGSDPVAVDSVGSAMMGFNPEDLEYLRLARLKGFGELDLRRVEVVGKPLAEVTRPFALGSHRPGVGYLGAGLRDWLVAPVGETGGWVLHQSDSRYVDLTRSLGDISEVLAYTEVECDEETPVDIWLGSDGPSDLFLGGEPVLSHRPSDGHWFGEARSAIRLPRGRSGFLLRLARGESGLGFSLMLCGRPGQLALGIHYVVPDVRSAEAARKV